MNPSDLFQDMNPSDLFQDWREADQAAAAAERAVADRSILALEGQGDPPSDIESRQARRLRQAANDVFERAMATMDELVRAHLRHSRVRGGKSG